MNEMPEGPRPERSHSQDETRLDLMAGNLYGALAGYGAEFPQEFSLSEPRIAVTQYFDNILGLTPEKQLERVAAAYKEADKSRHMLSSNDRRVLVMFRNLFVELQSYAKKAPKEFEDSVIRQEVMRRLSLMAEHDRKSRITRQTTDLAAQFKKKGST